MADIDGRSQIWAFIVYPESLPDNWLDILRDLHTIGAISPLHDGDYNPTGELKKPHYHVLLKFPTKKSVFQITNICLKLGSHVPPQPVDNFDGYLRYLAHVDNPEKAQYSVDDIIPLCGLDVDSYFAPSKSRVSEIIAQISQFVNDHPEVVDADILMGYACSDKSWEYVLNQYPCYGIWRRISARSARLYSYNLNKAVKK